MKKRVRCRKNPREREGGKDSVHSHRFTEERKKQRIGSKEDGRQARGEKVELSSQRKCLVYPPKRSLRRIFPIPVCRTESVRKHLGTRRGYRTAIDKGIRNQNETTPSYDIPSPWVFVPWKKTILFLILPRALYLSEPSFLASLFFCLFLLLFLYLILGNGRQPNNRKDSSFAWSDLKDRERKIE